LSTFGSAQYDTSLDTVFHEPPAAASALKLQVAERLAAHRHRTHRPATAEPQPASKPSGERATRIAAAVAERYAKSPTYRAFLAAEAERGVRQAAAEAEAVERRAEAIALERKRLLAGLNAELKAKQELKTKLELCAETAPQSSPAAPLRVSKPARQSVSARASKPETAQATPSKNVAPAPGASFAGLTVLPFGGAEPNRPFAPQALAAPCPSHRLDISRRDVADIAEALALDEEIAFRRDPVFEEPPEPAMPLPANLIEFPRQLVAARKARPRHAEGPLLADDDATGRTQLRIFEVEPTQISLTPAIEAAAPEWSSIWLDAIAPDPGETSLAEPQTLHRETPEKTAAAPIQLHGISGRQAELHPRPHTAPISRRLLAATLDGGLVLGAFMTFTAGFALATGAPAGSVPSLIAGQLGIAASCVVAAVALGFLYVAYHMLFCSLTEGTPGMRCARIALCTFSDENPTRSAMRRRVAALLLSACALGLGLLWIALDEDRLGWHDRITGIYPRKY
jgi:uncharacterized RDD family membrane protein YckC